MSSEAEVEVDCGICKRPEEGDMVQCDDCDKWFHFHCAGVSASIETSSWICNECTNNNTVVATEPKAQQEKTSQPTDNAKQVQKSVQECAGLVGGALDVRLELLRLEEEQQTSLLFLKRKYEILQKHGVTDDTNIKANAAISCMSAVLNATNQNTHGNVQGAASYFVPNNIVHSANSQAREAVQIPHSGISTQASDNRVYSTFMQTGSTPYVDGYCRQVQGGRCDGRDSGNHECGQYNQSQYCRNTPSRTYLRPEQIQARHAIPKELPTFSGKPEEWPVFISNFESSTRVCGFSNDENMLRLQRALKGKAYEYVSSQLLLPELVPEVIATLQMVFGKPEFLINSILEKIRFSAGVNANKLETLVNFSLEVKT